MHRTLNLPRRCASALGTSLLSRLCPFVRREIVGRGNQRHMRESLGEIAQLSSCARVVFLRQQANVIAEGEQVLEEFESLGATARQYQVVHVPETAREECPSPGGRPSSVFAV